MAEDPGVDGLDQPESGEGEVEIQKALFVANYDAAVAACTQVGGCVQVACGLVWDALEARLVLALQACHFEG